MTTNDHYDLIARTRGAMKVCGACHTEHPVADFAFKYKRDLKLHSQCRTAQRQRASTWYKTHSEQHRANVSAHRHLMVVEVDALIDGWLHGQACPCGAVERLTAVGRDGTNLRRLVKDGWTAVDIGAELPGAVARCLSCRTRPGFPSPTGPATAGMMRPPP